MQALAVQTVRVGLYHNSPKVAYSETGRAEGIFVDLIEAIAEKEGWTLEYVPGSWGEGLDRLAAGQIDIMPDVAYSTARDGLYDYHDEPVLTSWFQVYTRHGSGIRSIPDMAGKRVMVLERSVQQAAFKQLTDSFGFKITLIPVQSYSRMFEHVAAGDADAAITNRYYGLKHAKKYALEDTAVVFHPSNLFFAARNGKNGRLLDAIDRHLRLMKSDPQSAYYRSLQRWTSDAVELSLPLWVKSTAFAFSLILLLSFVGSILLKRQVNARTLQLLRSNQEMTKINDTLRISEAANRLSNRAIEASANGIMITAIRSADHPIIYVNPAFERITGYSSDEVINRDPRFLRGDNTEQPELNEIRAAIREQREGEAILRNYHKDGSLFWNKLTIAPVPDDTGKVTHFIGIINNITKRMRAEDKLIRLNATLEARVKERTSELQLARDQAEAANQAKSHFLSNMSHEIRSPLTAIIGFSESLQTDELSPAERRGNISTVTRNARYLLQVINDILDLSKIEAGQLNVEQISTPLFPLLGDLDSLLGTSARNKGLEFRIKYHLPLPETIVTDPVRLKQILVNLCSNAIKFTDSGGIEIEVSSDPDFGRLQFTVSDSGIGMSAAEMATIFDPFTQADATVTRKYGGTGLGLPISLKLATALGGELKCESHKGQSSRFMLTVVNHDQAQATAINRLEEASLHHHESHDQVEIKPLNGRILLVEDSADNQQLVSMYIQKTGAQLSIAENGLQAITIALEQAFDLILMDMQMPVMGGLEAIRQLRADGYTRPIVALSANALLSDQKKCTAAGADDYLLKPIEQYRFYQVLNRYLAEDTSATSLKKNRERQQAMQESPQYQAMVAGFLDSLPQMLDEISAALHEKNWETLQTRSHDLKGMGGALGYPKITELAGEVNRLVKQQNHEALADACTALRTHCHSIVLQDNSHKS
ncbi:MAG: transporter substrate-binding domain-containing protein [Gammaproteobacteria bacterium]|nr:transporter substrate-binding domain-containing protein [Gammaproteobacteria bacterium]